MRIALALLLALLPLVAGATPCDDHTPLRRAYFGDTHVHTAWSLDAVGRFGARATPDEAYTFARGETIALPPFDEQGLSGRSLQLDRPLDFAAVTDHAENLDFVRICRGSEHPAGDRWSCGLSEISSRLLARPLQYLAQLTGSDNLYHCGADGSTCTEARADVWRDTVDAATRHNSPCEFTTFNAYEWSGGKAAAMAMLHRNVLFASANVPGTAISAVQAPQPAQLWQALAEQCLEQDGCDAIAIPHNSNMSRGLMFAGAGDDNAPMDADNTALRSRYERLAEIYQHKGSSECYYDPLQSEDELCAFEYLPYSTTLDKYLRGSLPSQVTPPENDSRFLREALREGLRVERRTGTNPFRFGFVASTDTHIAAPGAVRERDYAGHHGAQDLSQDAVLVDRLEQGPGGLAVVYAEQNTREALFAGMQRREAYGTSGTRIGLRFFGGDDLPADLCQRPDAIAQGYARGVPMGGEFALPRNSDGPVFMASASRDPAGGTDLQRLQVIKGWVDAQGVSREQVIDIAGDAGNGAGVDLATCEPVGSGAATLCAVWRDPEHDPKLPAWYYARAVANPSCRWSTHVCVAQAVDCRAADALPASLQHCCDATVPATVQERAWSSPIWVEGQVAIGSL